MSCREHLSQLRRREADWNERDARVLVVTFQGGPVADAYARETRLPWPILIDESRRLYRAYGMEQGRWWDLIGPAAVGVYARLMMRGWLPRSPQGADVRQLGGDVIIDPAGIVRYHHIGSGPADRPPIDELLAVLRTSGHDLDP
ncbi:MAG TPA: redoxin domain-containing protein [Planctomycetaceae bacterium]|nr:redoxin domain-containing protein [Planctomycetaceae bacterium]